MRVQHFVVVPKEGKILTTFKNKMLRRVFGAHKKKVTGIWKNKDLHSSVRRA
jgi:hypothetical protein